MRLLAVSTWLPYPLDNGSRVRAYHLLRHLARQHSVTLLAFGTLTESEDTAPLRAFCADVTVVPPSTLAGRRLSARGLLSPVPRYFVQTDSPAMRSLIVRHVPRHDVAIGMQVDAARYLRAARIPRIFEEAEVGLILDRYARADSPVKRVRHGLTWWKSRRFVGHLANDFDRTTVVSARERNHLQAIGCDVRRVAIVPNGVEVPRSAMPTRRVPRLVYPGSVQYVANLDAVAYFVREILPLVRKRRADVEFTVTGSTSGVDLGGLDRCNGVVFTGRLPEIDTLIAESAACVVPLRIGGGTRLKVLQAMALGTPVVSTRKGIEGLDQDIERHVLLADRPADYADLILQLLDEPMLGSRLAISARAFVQERYTWGSIGVALDEVIEAALAEHALSAATPNLASMRQKLRRPAPTPSRCG
jgi:glycosyltransferase involved in cell wall biosynthesis